MNSQIRFIIQEILTPSILFDVAIVNDNSTNGTAESDLPTFEETPECQPLTVNFKQPSTEIYVCVLPLINPSSEATSITSLAIIDGSFSAMTFLE